MSKRSGRETYTAIVSSLMSHARTKAEVSKHSGVCRQTVNDVVNLMHDRQLAYVKAWRSHPNGARPCAVYAWQPEIGRHADAVVPDALGATEAA